MVIKKSALIAALLIAAITVYAGEERIEKSFQVNAGGTLDVNAEFGSIEIIPQKKNEVNVLIVFKTRTGSSERLKESIRDLDIQIKQSGNDVNVVLQKERTSILGNWWKKYQVNFEISVPKQYHVKLRTSGGSIAVGDLEGNVWSRTSGGSLKFGGITGEVDGKTSGGSIRLEKCKGPVDVSTSGGSIHIGEVMGEVEAHTSGGGITVDEVQGTVRAHTSGGSVKTKITKQPASDCELRTSGGSIHVTLAENIHVNVDAKTSGGKVYTDFPVTVKGNISGHSLNAQINGGGPMIYLRTSGGGISIEKIQ
ncbi:DUF4097 family beta strand repeat protein [bacterium]|nr:DUF4097 family beta strand repeat protein [bacterium]